jgi:hypothetical protein
MVLIPKFGQNPARDELILLDQREVADIMKVAPRSLEGMRFRGQGPKFIKISKTRVRYRLSDVQAFLESRTIETE